MPKAYFEPENLNALAEVFTEAKRRLSSRDINDPAALDLMASRILRLAADGYPPWMIVREIVERETKPFHGGSNESTDETTTSIVPKDGASP